MRLDHSLVSELPIRTNREILDLWSRMLVGDSDVDDNKVTLCWRLVFDVGA